MKRESEKALKNIALFPLRLAWGIIKTALVIVLAIVITLAVVCFSRASQSMNMPAAEGMTYNDFIADRTKAMDPNSDFTFIEKSKNVTLPVIRSFLVSYPVTYSALCPTCKISKWSQLHIQNFYNFQPTEEISEWNNLPNLFWNAFEHASWINLVRNKPEIRKPITPLSTPEPTVPPSLAPETGTNF